MTREQIGRFRDSSAAATRDRVIAIRLLIESADRNSPFSDPELVGNLGERLAQGQYEQVVAEYLQKRGCTMNDLIDQLLA